MSVSIYVWSIHSNMWQKKEALPDRTQLGSYTNTTMISGGGDGGDDGWQAHTVVSINGSDSMHCRRLLLPPLAEAHRLTGWRWRRRTLVYTTSNSLALVWPRLLVRLHSVDRAPCSPAELSPPKLREKSGEVRRVPHCHALRFPSSCTHSWRPQQQQ